MFPSLIFHKFKTHLLLILGLLTFSGDQAKAAYRLDGNKKIIAGTVMFSLLPIFIAIDKYALNKSKSWTEYRQMLFSISKGSFKSRVARIGITGAAIPWVGFFGRGFFWHFIPAAKKISINTAETCAELTKDFVDWLASFSH